MTLAINQVDGYGPSNSTSCTPDNENKVEAVLAILLAIEQRHINYQAVATRWRASVIKMRVQTHSNAFKRRLGFSCTVIILAVKRFHY